MSKLTKSLSVLLSCSVMLSSILFVPSFNNKEYTDYALNAHAEELALTEILTPDTKNVSSAPFDVFGIYDAYNGAATTAVTTTTTQTTTTTTVPEPILLNGIDVSEHQAYVDWSKVASDDFGVDFAIVRAGYGREYYQKDKYFDQNMINAQKNGVPCGVYWYSYADSVEAAYKEAEVCYSIIQNYDYEYPVYFDIEEKVHSSMTTAEASAIIEAFCSTIKSKGYRVGIYSYASFLSTKVYTSVLNKYDVWVAHYGVAKPAFNGSYGIWQYTSEGMIDGISRTVDLNYCYVDYTGKGNQNDSPVVTTAPTETTAPVATTTTVKTDTTDVNCEPINGINVSVWQGDIDWNSVKQSGVEFAIIRAGYGNLPEQEDKYFDQNMVNAQAADIACGAYWYSYALSPEEAVQEAEVCYSIIKDYEYDYPIIFAFEDYTQANLTATESSAIVDAFCSTLAAKGYRTAVQSYTSLLSQKISNEVLEKYDVCVEHFNVATPAFSGKYTMWHYSCTGSVSGINGDVNLLYSYYDYPSAVE